jgi:mono/diheme cytochrome c family protein
VRTVIAALITVMCTAVANAVAQNASTAPTPGGNAVYEKWCAPCHAAGPFHAGTAGLQIKYKGSNEPAVLVERTDLTPVLVKFYVRNGSNAMPPFRKTEISPAELDALANFLSHKKTP